MTEYERRVKQLEEEGLTTSDAQGVADAEGLCPFTQPEFIQRWKEQRSRRGSSMGRLILPANWDGDGLEGAL